MKNSIFNKKIESTNKIFISKSNNYWSFKKDNKSYTLSPSSAVRINLSPIILGADKAILNACKLKNINPDNGFYLIFDTNEFLDCDIRLEYKDKMFDGWIYNIFSEKLKIDETQKIWACDYLNLYYENPPKKIYIRIE